MSRFYVHGNIPWEKQGRKVHVVRDYDGRVFAMSKGEARTLARDLLAAVGEPMPDPVIEWGVRRPNGEVEFGAYPDRAAAEHDARYGGEVVRRIAVYGEWVEVDEPGETESDDGTTS